MPWKITARSHYTMKVILGLRRISSYPMTTVPIWSLYSEHIISIHTNYCPILMKCPLVLSSRPASWHTSVLLLDRALGSISSFFFPSLVQYSRHITAELLQSVSKISICNDHHVLLGCYQPRLVRIAITSSATTFIGLAIFAFVLWFWAKHLKRLCAILYSQID